MTLREARKLKHGDRIEFWIGSMTPRSALVQSQSKLGVTITYDCPYSIATIFTGPDSANYWSHWHRKP